MIEPLEKQGRAIFVAMGLLAMVVFAMCGATPAQAQDCPTPGPENHTYVFADSLSLAPGTVLRAESESGECAGQATYPDAGSAAMAVMGQMQQGGRVLADGDPIVFLADGEELTLTEQAVIGDAPPSTYTPDALTVVTSATIQQPAPVPVTIAWATDAVRVSQDTWRVSLNIDAPIDLGRIDGLHLDVQGARDLDVIAAYQADTLDADTLRSWAFDADLRSGSATLSGPAPAEGQTAEVYIEGGGVSIDQGEQPASINFGTRALSVERAAAVMAGDVTGDGSVTIADVLRVVQFLNFPQSAALTDRQGEAADLNGDGSVTQYDVWRLFFLIQ